MRLIIESRFWLRKLTQEILFTYSKLVNDFVFWNLTKDWEKFLCDLTNVFAAQYNIVLNFTSFE